MLRGESIESRNQDAKTLLNYAFASYTLCPLQPEEPLREMPVDMGAQDSVALRVEGERWAVVPKSGAQPEYRLTLPDRAEAPLREGQRLGTLTVTLDGATIAELPVMAAEEVPRLGYGGVLRKLLRAMIGL